ncbi:MAG: 1-acyl-sn-glycerol-3-phosphate acyltransferase [Snowella sp.]|nr:1-acyl-sn-glycerol-3-phosphate acyltransferase [Snowella sp.]
MRLSAIATPTPELLDSTIDSWLMDIIYPFGRNLLMPLYFGHLEITGKENVPKTGPVIVAPTHRSRWDAVVVSLATGRQVSGRDLRFMVTSSEVTGIQGWFIRHLGGFPIDIQRPEVSSLTYSVALLKQGEMLVIFPEGGIFRDRQVHRLKRGVARIALDVLKQNPHSDIKILPVSLRYSQPYPTWGTDIQVDIGQPITVANYDTEKIRTSSEALTNELQNRLKKLHETSA